jgi:quercetin dioxygenase-like cupin family protein
MALDHPDRVTAAAVLDVVPTGEVWSRADARMAVGYWHWAFLAQPAPLPERLIGADPDAFFDLHVRALGLGGVPDRYPPELMTAYRELLDDQSTVQAICEDYRAGAGVDRDHDDADRGHHLIACPLLVLWSAHGALPRFYGDVLDVWRPWADRVAGEGLDASHFLVEDQPDRVADLLSGFLQREGPAMTDDSLAPAPPRDALAGTLARTEIQRAGSSFPGREIVQVRTDIPVGVASGWHTHPGEEVGYILAGTVQMEIDGHPTRVLTAGDGFLVPPRVAHNATDLGPGTGQMLSTYIVEIGEPIASVAT